MADRISQRYDSKAKWDLANPVLLRGEVGYEEGENDPHVFTQYKIGDGVRKWKDLPYNGLPCLNQLGDNELTPISQAAVTKEIKKLVQKRTILNVSQETLNYAFPTKEDARISVEKELRGLGQMIIYKLENGKIVIEYSIVQDINNDTIWKSNSSWKAVGSGGGAFNVSEDTENYSIESKEVARNYVDKNDRKYGSMISYRLSTGEWVFEMFVGDDLDLWSDNTKWNQIATDKDLAEFKDLLDEAIEGLNQSVADSEKKIDDAIAEMNETMTTKLSDMEAFIDQSIKYVTAIAEGRADNVTLTSDNKLQLMSGTKPVGDPLELPSGIINLSYKDNTEYPSGTDARKKVAVSSRILGQIITYKLNDGTWVLDQFIGESVGSWESEGSWVGYALVRDLSPLIADLESVKSQISALDAAVAAKVDGGYPEENGSEDNYDLVLTSNGIEVARIQLPKGSGGGGTPTGALMKIQAVGSTSIVVGEGANAVIKWNWSSIDQETSTPTGDGTLYITVNGIPVYNNATPQGENQFDVKDSLNLGANNVVVRVTDSYNNARSVRYSVQKASLILTSTFADDTIYKNVPVAFRYTPIGSGDKKIRFWVNGVEIESDSTTASGKQLTKNLTNLNSGANSIRVIAESNVEGSQLTSNELYYEFIYADAGVTQPVITISYKGQKVHQFGLVSIPYLVYDPNNLNAAIELRIDGVVKQKLIVPRARQYWDYVASEQGTFTMEIKCGTVTKSVRIEVTASEYDIAEEKGDLIYKASAIGKSNNGDDRAMWDYGVYTAIFKNFLWGEDGWHKDSNGANHLRIIGDASVDININPFSNSVVQNGMTTTIEFATQTVTDPNAEIIKCMSPDGGVGIVITPQKVLLQSAQSNISVNLDSSTKTSISFVVEKQVENRLIYLYVDGVMSGSVRYPNSDNFAQTPAQPLKLTSGGRSCTTMVYSLRWYSNNLNYSQVFGNFMYDIEDFDAKIEKFKNNDIIDDYGSISYTKALEFLPCLTIIGDLPTFKGDKKTCTMVYEDRNNPQLSWIAHNVQNDVQGTSSQYYPRKNFKARFTDGFTLTDTGIKSKGYSINGTQIEASVFDFKADFAESSGTHNTGLAIIIDESLRKLGYLIPQQKVDSRIRTTVFGIPILIFHKEDDNSQAEFVGKYNFNDDKESSAVFGFEDVVENWEVLNNTSDRVLFRSADFTGTDYLNDFECHQPYGNTDATELSILVSWVVSCIGDPDKFKKEAAEHWDVNFLLHYYLCTEIFAQVDQRAKNMALTSYGDRNSKGNRIWRPIFFDNDTSLGINNEGIISFSYDVEPSDQIGSGHVWNGWDSELWKLVKQSFEPEYTALYQKMRQSNILGYEESLSVFQGKLADFWSESIYNRDSYYKYLEPMLLNNDSSYLYALQGSRTNHRKWWLRNRFSYMDSKYRAGSYMNNYATMRLYTPREWTGVAPNADFNLTINRPGYFHVKYGSYLTQSTRGYAGQTYRIPAPSTQFNDTETIIYGISSVKSLGDLAPKYPGTVDISNALALEDLTLGSLVSGYKNQNLTTLHTGTNEMLKKVNVANCPNLKQALELNKCYSLESVEARGSGITGLDLPSSGILKMLHLPASFTSLYLKNQPYLTEVTLEGYTNINTIVVDKVPSINGYALVKSVVESGSTKLSKVRITNIDAFDATAKTLTALLGMTGEDDNGNPTDNAFVTGKLHVDTIIQDTYDRAVIAFPYLIITYTTILDVVVFADPIVKSKAVAKFDTNKDGEISMNEIQFSTIPSNFLTGSGAKLFNEAYYWKGIGSMVNNCDTLEELTIFPGNQVAENLPKLKTLGLWDNGESTTDAPKLTYNTVRNLFDVQMFRLYGRYVETARGGAILAKAFTSPVNYYRLCLPLRGYTTLNIIEPIMINATDFMESTYPWGKDIETLSLGKLYKVVVPTGFVNLKNVLINGIDGQSPSANSLSVNSVSLDTLVISDTTGNSLASFFIGETARIPNIIINGLTCSQSITGSYFQIARNGTRSIKMLDFPESYQPVQIRLDCYQRSYPFDFDFRIVLRSSRLITASFGNDVQYLFPDMRGKVYVPDSLVSSYKAATGWNQISSYIFPLSSLG